jgi:hypothetical protein
MELLNELVGYLNIPADEVYTNNPTKITYNFYKDEEYYPSYTTNRYGTTCTNVNGVLYFIGGEHEDYYDPNFFIYNDVIKIEDRKVTIYWYPRDIFPPTDFHASVYLNGFIWIFGNIGYKSLRKKFIQVCRLNINTMKIENLNNSSGPLWTHFEDNSITIQDNSIKVNNFLFDTVTFTWTECL